MSSLTLQQALGLALEQHRAGRLAAAEEIYRQVLGQQPDHPDALHMLGVLAHQVGRHAAAVDLIRRAIALNPSVAEYHHNLGTALRRHGRPDDAAAACRRALEIRPDYAEACNNLGNALRDQRRLDDALAAYRRALEIRPDYAEAHYNSGVVFGDQRRLDEEIAAYRRALAIRPEYAKAHNNLGTALKAQGQLAAAVAAYRAAIELQPENAMFHSNLGEALAKAGDPRGAIAALRRAVALDPDLAAARSSLIFHLQYLPEVGAAELAREQEQWNERHGARRNGDPRHDNDPSPHRPLRIGYVSADLRDHVVGRTLLPCFEAHDRSAFELVCYSGTTPSDAIGERFRDGAAKWRETALLSDEDLAAQIRADRIDILVDLSLHTAGNRLPVFARRPAPVQISWLGYPASTGLPAIDCHISDPHLEPAGGGETPLRLPDGWSCYAAPESAPEPGELPAARHGHVTFGSFNNFAKINERVLALWAEILGRNEGSHLRLLSRTGRQEQAAAFFERREIAAHRVEFLPYHPQAGGRGLFESFARYRHIDIALDPFPYNGMTTTCDALWMGVPVVALIGDRPLGRASYSLLSNVGLPELAGHSEGEYAEIATSLAADLSRLASLRATLRARMKASPLMDAARFTRNLEAAFRSIWQRWCATRGGRI